MAHVPVLAAEVSQLLELRPGDTVVDCTFGAGGHASVLEPQIGPEGTYVAIDRDPEAKRHFDLFAARATARSRFIRGNFALALRNLAATGTRADAVLMDLGMSSMQVDQAERGFSYAADAPLDMRMDPSAELTAAEVVNEWDEREIAQVLAQYGEERFARQIARSIVRRRSSEPFERTGDLVDVIKSAIPTPSRFGQGHPAKRSFQALRIAVNDELESLREGLDNSLEALRPGGRLAVISFHSLEDRIAKRFIRDRARGCTCPPEFPICVCGHEPELRALTGRAVVPTVEERSENPRSASAKLRAAERDRRRVSVAAPAPRTAKPRRAAPRQQRARTTPQRSRGRRLSPAFLWIIVLAVLFAGIVALNVGALRGTIEASTIETETSALKTQNADLASQVAGMSGYFRIASEAKRLGMVPSSPPRKAFIPFQPGTATPHHATTTPKHKAETPPPDAAARHPRQGP